MTSNLPAAALAIAGSGALGGLARLRNKYADKHSFRLTKDHLNWVCRHCQMVVTNDVKGRALISFGPNKLEGTLCPPPPRDDVPSREMKQLLADRLRMEGVHIYESLDGVDTTRVGARRGR